MTFWMKVGGWFKSAWNWIKTGKNWVWVVVGLVVLVLLILLLVWRRKNKLIKALYNKARDYQAKLKVSVFEKDKAALEAKIEMKKGDAKKHEETIKGLDFAIGEMKEIRREKITENAKLKGASADELSKRLSEAGL